MKNNISSIFLIIIVVSFLNFACTVERNTMEVLDVFDTTDLKSIDTIAEASPYFSVDINGENFLADEIGFKKEGSKISIVGKEFSTNTIVFLTINMDSNNETNIFPVGNYIGNQGENVAGLLFKNENIGYVTSEIYNSCGEIVLNRSDDNNTILNGSFNFDACDYYNDVMELTNGIFNNIPMNEQ